MKQKNTICTLNRPGAGYFFFKGCWKSQFPRIWLDPIQLAPVRGFIFNAQLYSTWGDEAIWRTRISSNALKLPTRTPRKHQVLMFENSGYTFDVWKEQNHRNTKLIPLSFSIGSWGRMTQSSDPTALRKWGFGTDNPEKHGVLPFDFGIGTSSVQRMLAHPRCCLAAWNF